MPNINVMLVEMHDTRSVSSEVSLFGLVLCCVSNRQLWRRFDVRLVCSGEVLFGLVLISKVLFGLVLSNPLTATNVWHVWLLDNYADYAKFV